MNKKLTDFLIFPFSCLHIFSYHENVRGRVLHSYRHCAQGVVVYRFRLNSEKIKEHKNMDNNTYSGVM